ncbi:hypothetical protein chiPu_0027701 [Chiloscyllium punctatum]|uniref:Uncharacterized protein n=1 Tax=Chiloscyllium punctatum TaxID=137246 RepID=A0A401TM98_CHIPU|nr:hypothetical protein [Chiloscyllium punctatum]
MVAPNALTDAEYRQSQERARPPLHTEPIGCGEAGLTRILTNQRALSWVSASRFEPMVVQYSMTDATFVQS